MHDQPEIGVGEQVDHRLADLGERPVGEHVEIFDDVHRFLQDTLATLDEA